MNIHSDILTLANKYPLMLNEVEKLQTIERIIPGSVTYSIHRYKKNPQWSVEDVGMLSYNFEKPNPEANSIELK
ncbi:MAG TPA: AraC family transcriptional regulator, partial [Chitinophagaceae bacterium]|nr:AraC family transcriptional regulator [Chitinophagaceae bacterium]